MLVMYMWYVCGGMYVVVCMWWCACGGVHVLYFLFDPALILIPNNYKANMQMFAKVVFRENLSLLFIL